MKNLKIIATGAIRENVDNSEAARLVAEGHAVELPATYAVLGHRDPAPAAIGHRDPITTPGK